MKGKYSQPMLHVEKFTPNSAVAACTVNKGIEWTFDCMKGPDTDSVTVVNDALTGDGSACETKIGYAEGVLTAYSFGEERHSNNNSSLATWGEGTANTGEDGFTGDYLSVTYSRGDGLVYADSQKNKGQNTYTVSTTPWQVMTIGGTKVVAHSSNGGLTHRMVAPVLDASSVNASW